MSLTLNELLQNALRSILHTTTSKNAPKEKNLMEYERRWMQNNQLPPESHVELEDSSSILSTRVIVNNSIISMIILNLETRNVSRFQCTRKLERIS